MTLVDLPGRKQIPSDTVHGNDSTSNSKTAQQKTEDTLEEVMLFVTTGILTGMATLVGRYLLTSLYQRLLIGRSSPDENTKSKNPEDSLLTRFPWEPQTQHISTVTKESNEKETPRDGVNDQKSASEQDQLQFLAQMSFANGGLRAPSCPCCQ